MGLFKRKTIQEKRELAKKKLQRKLKKEKEEIRIEQEKQKQRKKILDDEEKFRNEINKIKENGLTKSEREYLERKKAKREETIKQIKGGAKRVGKSIVKTMEIIGEVITAEDKRNDNIKSFIRKVRSDLKTKNITRDRLLKIIAIIRREYNNSSNQQIRKSLSLLRKSVDKKLKSKPKSKKRK